MEILTTTLFSMLSHDTRLRCLMLLLTFGELCVSELNDSVEASQPFLSRHLTLLREAGMIVGRRDHPWIYYRINSELPAWAMNVLHTMKGVQGVEPFASDLRAIKKRHNRQAAENVT